MLKALGYVEIEKGTGCKVRTCVDPKISNPLVFQLVLQSTERCEHLFEFRLTIETAASLLAIDKADSGKLQGNQEHLAHGASTLADDHQLRLLIYASTHNPYLMIIGKTVMELFYHSLAIAKCDYPEQVVQESE